MPFEEREAILNELLVVDKVISFDDRDNTMSCNRNGKTLI